MAEHRLKGYVITDLLRGTAPPGISAQPLGTFCFNHINLALATHLPHPPAPVIELGIPLDAMYYEATLAAPLGRVGYSFEIVRTMATPADAPDAPRFLDYFRPDTPTIIIAWRRRVRYEGIPAYLEALWSPTTTETIVIRGVEQDLSFRFHARVKPAITLLREVHGGRQGGRPPLATRHYTPETFYAAWPEKLAQAERHRRGVRLTHADLARAYSVSLSTFYRYLREYGNPQSS